MKEEKEIKKVKKNKEKELLEKLENDNAELGEKIKYLQADLINYRKRKDDELVERMKYANQDLIIDILPIVDNFEMALRNNNVSDEVKNYLSGFKMMYTSLLQVLKNYGVEEISRVGEIFDPNIEQALLTEENNDYPDECVLEVLQKGYKLKDRIIRPATVKINKLNKKGEK